MHVLSCLCFHHRFSFPVADGYSLLLRILAKTFYQLAYACSGYEPRPHLLVAVEIIWQAQNGDPIRAYRSSKTPDKCMYMFSVMHKARGDTVLGHVR